MAGSTTGGIKSRVEFAPSSAPTNRAVFPSSDRNRPTPLTSSRSKTGVASAATSNSHLTPGDRPAGARAPATESSPISPTPLPDLPIGTNDAPHLEGSCVVLDLGGQRYVMFARLKR
jgi:hypothetical protein